MRNYKQAFVLALLLVYISIGFLPSFRIKLAPLAGTAGVQDGTNYFLENFLHNWELKLTIAILTAIAAGLLANSRNISEGNTSR
ncbi:hypothetical protein [Anaerotalea alkaliphila]|uniref:Uncharacterized protein n=1 Tax=Anaerotalea alkaliphila TaxID=2662126 RepID=A0A7X5HTK2_9FIRM|nr:hypothetical protein [Anaerotalea alkaliphila]NDL66396.1 hypothetical protein [Anaerotalea alkaliphila]